MAVKKDESKAVVTTNSNIAMMEFSNERPEWVRDTGRGSEQVGRDEIIIPRIEVAQSLSKCRKKNDPAYIEGIQEGDLYNSLTRENYGPELMIIPVAFGKEYILWRDQQLGGGFAGAFPTEEQANLELSYQEKPEEWEVTLTHQQYVLLITSSGNVEEAVISMSKSKLKVSRSLNSQIRLVKADRWARAFMMYGVADQNANGQDFFNMSFKPKGYIPQQMYSACEALYESVISGAATADRGVDDIDAEAEEM